MNGNLAYSITGNTNKFFICVERKSAHDGSGTDSVVAVLERMEEERAFQREEKLRKLELEGEERRMKLETEAEERRRDSEQRQEERMMRMFAAFVQQASGGSHAHGLFSAQPLQYSSGPYYQGGLPSDYYCDPAQDSWWRIC